MKCKIYINHFAMCIYDLRTINIMDTKLKWMDDLRNLSGRKNVISLFLYFIRGCLCQIIFEMLRLKGQCFSGFIICQAFCFTNMINQLRISFVNVKRKYIYAWIFKYYQNLPSSISYCLFVRLRFIVCLHTVC